MDPILHTIYKREHRVMMFTNHALVLIWLAKDGGIRIRDVAVHVGITERAVQRIIEDLTVSGIIVVSKKGRRNRYKIREENHLDYQVEGMNTVSDLLRCAFPHPQAS